MELRLIAAALRRRLVVIILSAFIGAVVAALVLESQIGTYRSTASVLMDPLSVTTPLGQPFTGDPERYIGGQIRILQGQDLAARAAERVEGQTAESLVEAVTVTHTVGSDLVDVTATSTRPGQAQALANAVADTYVEQRRAELAAQTKAVVDEVNREATSIQTAVAALTGTSPTVESNRQLLLSQYQQVLDRRRSVTAPGATRDITRVLDPAPLPRKAVKLPRVPTLAAGAVAGALLALSLSVLAEALTPRITNRRQLERITRAPVLSAFRKSGRARSNQEAVVKRVLPEARTLVSLVELTPNEGKRRVVGVCGVRRGAGATTIATALAEAFAEQGANVVLVQAAAAVRGPALDGDTAEASYGKRSDLPQDTWEFVAEPDSSLPSAAWADVSTAHWTGRRPPRGDDLAALVDELPPVHDVVVLDLPPVLESPLPTAVTPWVQDVVMLVRLPHELESDVTLAHGMLASTRADLRLQVVPNHPSRARLS